jgi:hypothetical protein
MMEQLDKANKGKADIKMEKKPEKQEKSNLNQVTGIFQRNRSIRPESRSGQRPSSPVSNHIMGDEQLRKDVEGLFANDDGDSREEDALAAEQEQEEAYHALCVANAVAGKPKVCFSFYKTGVCKDGDKCRYDHVKANADKLYELRIKDLVENMRSEDTEKLVAEIMKVAKEHKDKSARPKA